MKKIIASLTAALLMIGCATTQFYVPAGSEAKFNQEKAQCEYESALHVQGPVYGSQTIFGDAFDVADRRADLQVMCMKSKGWYQVTR